MFLASNLLFHKPCAILAKIKKDKNCAIADEEVSDKKQEKKYNYTKRK